MKINEGRESAYVASRVTDNSSISNNVEFAAFFSVITPKSSPIIESDTYCKKTQDGRVYFLPYLVRDVETLDRVFGDARVNPNVFKDLYSVRYLVQQGISCYVSKVYSGTNFESILSTESFFEKDAKKVRDANNQKDGKVDILFRATSTIAGTADVRMSLKPIKPFSLNQVYLSVELVSILEDEENVVSSTNVLLKLDTKNVDLVSTINSYLNSDLNIELFDPKYNDEESSSVQNAYDLNNEYVNISNLLLNLCCLYEKINPDAPLVASNMKLREKKNTEGDTEATGLKAIEIWPAVYYSNTDSEGIPKGFTFRMKNDVKTSSALEVSAEDYATSLETYSDIKYSGQFITELSANKAILIEELRTIYVKDEKDSGVELDKFTSSETGRELESGKWEDVTIGEGSSISSIVDPVNVYGWRKIAKQGAPIDSETVTVINEFYKSNGGGGYEPYTNKETSPSPTLYIKVGENYISCDDFKTTTADFGAWCTVPFKKDTIAKPDGKIPFDKDTVYGYKDTSNKHHMLPLFVKINGLLEERNENNYRVLHSDMKELSSEERRGLHYTMKMVASKRKDLTCIFATPFKPEDEYFDLQKACDWVASKGDYSNLFDYGDAQAVSYTEQSFYCEIYWSWVKWRVAKLVNGSATGSEVVTIPASIFVITNAIHSFKLKGTWYPVAGDQGGILPASCSIIDNPSLKSQRDQLISYRINPIYDTGTRGIQIYGNETLNAIYSDLSAAHVARTLVSIRNKVDNYSETIKFSLNNEKTWGTWINYVSTRILDPIKAGGGLRWFDVNMGWETTSREDIAKRKINGEIRLQFTSSLEIINVNYVVEASSANIEE